MHEMHIIRDLFQDLLHKAKDNQAERVSKVQLKMGEFTEINEEILRYFFKEQSQGTPLEGAKVVIEQSPTRELRLVSFEIDE